MAVFTVYMQLCSECNQLANCEGIHRPHSTPSMHTLHSVIHPEYHVTIQVPELYPGEERAGREGRQGVLKSSDSYTTDSCS